MSIEVRVPKEITEYKEKILFGLTIRQLLCFASAIILGLASYFIASRYWSTEIAGYVVILEVIPIFATGFFKKNGFTFEQYVKLILRHKLGQNKRKYQTELSLNRLKQNKEEVKNAKKSTSKKITDTEQPCFGSSEYERKRKLQAAMRSVEFAQKEFTRVKQEAKKTKSSLKRTANNQI
ncbi:MAG: PrgI family protein [Clostridiaceae bacterium]|nr:PrgI family protein [Clostridiaceae bacterium]